MVAVVRCLFHERRVSRLKLLCQSLQVDVGRWQRGGDYSYAIFTRGAAVGYHESEVWPDGSSEAVVPSAGRCVPWGFVVARDYL